MRGRAGSQIFIEVQRPLSSSCATWNRQHLRLESW